MHTWVLRMRKPIHSSRRLLAFWLFSSVALSVVGGCGKLRSPFAHKAPENPHSATLTWTASVSPVKGYNIYRESPLHDPIKLTTSLASGTQFVDKTVEAGHTYFYYVTSVDSEGVESRPSEKIKVTIPTTVSPPSK